MKAKDLIEKLNKLVAVKPDADVYFYADDQVVEFIGNGILEGDSLFDIEATVSKTIQEGSGIISVDMD